jgi:hypothetical protein
MPYSHSGTMGGTGKQPGSNYTKRGSMGHRKYTVPEELFL